MSGETKHSILFICTGNVFRSVVAEHALKALLQSNNSYTIGSAGIEATPQEIHPFIREQLRLKGCEITTHRPRKLTQDLLDETTLPVVMGVDHQVFIRRTFQRDVMLFNEICFRESRPILDLHEALPEWQSDLRASRDYVLSVIDHIFTAMPAFMTVLQEEKRGRRN